MSFNKKLFFIFLLFCFSYSLIVFNGIIDDFSPKHITAIEQISIKSHLDQNNRMTNQVPGFYVLGAIIKLISNISSMGFLTFPLQLLPLLIVFYEFILKICKSPVFSCILTFLSICAGTTGTDKLFFWPHGIGSIVYYTTFILIVSIMLNPFNKRSEYNLLLIICGCSLGFISYNVYITLLILMISLMLEIWFIQNKEIPSAFLNYKSFLGCSLIFIVTMFGLSRFVYETFIPTLKATSNIEISAINKFLLNYINTNPNPEISVISELLINYPRIITIISILKYLILCISVIIFISSLIKKISKKVELSVFDLIIISYIIYSFVYFLIRAYLGGIPITVIFLPGMLCIIWLYKFSEKYKQWTKFAIIMLLILTPSYTYFIEIYDLRNESIHENEYLIASSHWYFEHKGDSIGVSDEMSKNLISMFIYEKYHQPSGIKNIYIKNAEFLVNKSQFENFNQYYVVNYNLRCMSLQNWVIIKSWRFFETSIDSNKYICKIYDLDSVSIYY